MATVYGVVIIMENLHIKAPMMMGKLLSTGADEILHEEGKGGSGSTGLQSLSLSCSRCWKRELIHLLESPVEGCLFTLLTGHCVVPKDKWHWCIGSSFGNLELNHQNEEYGFAEVLENVSLTGQIMGFLGM